MAASALLTWVVRRELPEWAGKDARELLVYGPHGKPFLKGNPFYFNLSHSGGIVACAVQTCEVGLDVEKKREFSQRRRNVFVLLRNIFWFLPAAGKMKI